jgi:integrative and conjugative element protein (TIGR02256 family)
MQLLLPSQIVKRLHRELRRAGRREIGGLLMGEHVRDEIFRVVDVSIQRSGGTQACFIRNPGDHQTQLQEFFARTGEDYSRFNYLGEWHSHPTFEPAPSCADVHTMQSIVEDPAVGANFLTLLISKLSRGKGIEVTAMAFRAGASPIVIPISVETGSEAQPEGVAHRWLRKLFRL